MGRRRIVTTVLVLSLAVIAACGSDDSGTTQIEYGAYVRLADPSFESIDDCEAQKAEAGDGILFNCAQRLTINEDGTFFRVLTDIAESGTYTIEESSIVLTEDATGTTSEIPIDDDGTLGDRWELDPEADSEEE
jgi:hypothetical protein